MSGDSEKSSALDAGAGVGSTASCSLFSALCRLPGRLWSFAFFTQVNVLLGRGAEKNLDESTAAVIHPRDCDLDALFPRFKAIYGSLTVMMSQACYLILSDGLVLVRPRVKGNQIR